MNKIKLLLITAFICTTTLSLQAAKIEGKVKPKLVVNIVVGQMRYDYLLRFSDNFTQKGFLAMIREGSSCDRASYSYLNTATSTGLATITTGTLPSIHGVIGDSWFNYTNGNRIELIKDTKCYTVGADDLDAQVSPRQLIASTLGDQLKLVTPESKVVSIALEPTSAVLMGGHTSDAIYWLNEKDGKWVTSTYYTDKLPEWVKKFNEGNFADSYSAETWKVSFSTARYHNILSKDIVTDTASSFMSFDFLTRKKYDYKRLVASPSGNTLVKDFAIQAMIYENLGKDDKTDLLNIVFDASRNIGEKYGTLSMEVEDSYYKLDKEIASLLEFFASHVGHENMLVILTSDHGAADPSIESSRMPSGRFNTDQFAVLMNGFLGAQLGSDHDWVLDFSNNQIYLNRRAIYEKGLDLKDIQDKVAGFAIQFRGVSQAITASAMQNGHFTDGIMGKAQNGFFPRHSGDVVLNLLPGWTVENEKLSSSGSPYNYDTHVPLIWWGGMIGNKDVTNDVNMTDIAPTIANILSIPPPNSATGRTIYDILK